MRAKCSCTCVYSADGDGYRCYCLQVYRLHGKGNPSFSLIRYSMNKGPKPYPYKTFSALYSFVLKYLRANSYECINPLAPDLYDILFVNLQTGNSFKYHYKEDAQNV